MKKLKLFFACLLMAVLSIGQVWAATDFSFGYSQWKEGNTSITAQFSGTTKDEVTQTADGIVVTYARNGSNLYANSTNLRFYQKNTLQFDAPDGYVIKSITFTGSIGQTDITSSSATCTNTSSSLSWSGEATSVTFTRPNSASSYATISGASVTIASSGSGGGTGGGSSSGEGTLVITRSCFPSGALAYNVTDSWTATASTSESISGEGDLYSTASQTTMQTKNTNVSTHYHNTTALPGALKSISVDVASGTDRTYTVYASASAAITSTSGLTSIGTVTGASPLTNIDTSEGYKYFWMQCGGGASYLNNITITYESSSDPAVSAEPASFELDADAHSGNSVALTYANWGDVNVEEAEVTIHSASPCTNDNKITEATWISNTSIAANNGSFTFDVAENTGSARTLYLRFYALGDDATTESSAEITVAQAAPITPDYTTIAAFLADQPSTAKNVQFSGNVVVTGVNGKNIYVQDENGDAICLYFSTAPEWTKGHKVTGKFQAKYATYGNMPEMSITDNGSIAATETADIPAPTEITSLAEATINANMCKYVTLKSVYFQGQSLSSKAVDLKDGSNNVLKFYDNLSVTSGKVLPLTATTCDVTGILISYKSGTNNINEILPVDAACIVAGNATLPTISLVGSTDAANPTMVPNGQAITVTPNADFDCTLNGVDITTEQTVNVTETESNTVITITAARDYYTEATATYYFKAIPAGTKYTITITQPATGGTLGADFPETEEGTTVTLTATPNEHFTFNNDWVVKKSDDPTADPETVTDNKFSMPAYAVTVTGSFTEEGKATLTFAKGDATGTEDAPADVVDYAGEVTLPACPFTYADHYFTGWKKGSTEEIYQPGAYTITAADVTAGTVVFTAQWAEGYVFEWVAKDQGYDDQTVLSTVCTSPVTMAFSKGTGSNDPKYYNNGTNARYYTGGTLTITAPEGKLIKKVIFEATEWGVTASPATLDGKTWTGQAQEVVFTATATCKITKITVIYANGVTSTLEIDDIELEYKDVVTISPKSVTPAAAASTIEYSIKAGSDDCITLSDDQITAKEVAGTATIVATIPATQEYLGTSIEFTVTVSAPDTRKKAEITSLTSTSGTIVTVTEGTHKDKEYISYAAYQGDGTTEPAADGVLKIYKPSTGKSTGGYVVISAVKGCTIDEVQVTNANSKATTIGCSTTSTLATTGEAYAKNATVAFKDLNSSVVYIDDIGTERADITKITVYYDGDPASVDHYTLGGTYTTSFERNTTFNHDGLIVYACYDELETDKVDITSDCTFSNPDMNIVGEQTINITYNSAVVTSYTITVTAGKDLPNLVYNPASQTITQGDAWSAPELTYESGVTGITYGSDKESVATVDENGVIALAGGIGTAIITASFAGNDYFVAGSATYTITVNEPQDDLNGTWNLVTDAAQLQPGLKVIIAQYVTEDADIKTMGAQNSNNRAAVGSSVSGTVLTPAEGTKVLTIVDAGNGMLALQASNGKYLYAAGGTSNNHLKEQNNIDNRAQWTITIDNAGVATIKANITGSNKRDWMRYNTSGLFSCYGSGQADIVIYAKAFDVTRDVNGQLGTICLANGGKMVGAAPFEISHMDYDESNNPYKIYLDEVETMVPGVPYIFLPNEGATKLGVYFNDATPAVKAGNYRGLYGTFDEIFPLAQGYYIIYNNLYYNVNSDNVRILANRAYIKLSEVPDFDGSQNNPTGTKAPRRISIGNGSPKTTTGIDELNASEAPVKMLIDGQLFILRGEKVYDATGRLVK